MKSAVITSGDHWITIDGIDYLRGTIETIERLTYVQGDQEAVKISGSSVNASVILVDGTTIDGTEVASQQELVDFIKQYSFREGGSTGNTGVQWSDVSYAPEAGKIPRYSPQGLLSGNEALFAENYVPHYQVMYMIEDYNNSMRSTVQEIQEGTNDEKHITPYLLKTFVEWFSSQLLLIDEEYTDMPTSEQVNEKYPNARVRTLLYLPNAGSGMKYTKLNDTQWESQPYTIA